MVGSTRHRQRNQHVHRGLAVGAILLAGLALPQTALATQMTAANEPPALEAAGVTAGVWKEEPGDFTVKLAFSLICPAEKPVPLSVVFQVGYAKTLEPMEEITRRLLNPCEGTWAGSSTVSPMGTGFEVETFSGSPPFEARETGSPAEARFSPQWEVGPGNYPFLFQVVGPAGIIAQAPDTVGVEPERRIEQGSPEFQSECVEQGRVRYTSEGQGYCILAATVKYYRGWPASVPAAPGSPSSGKSKSESPSTPSPSPAKRNPALLCVVPRLRGDSIRAARRALRKAHCRLGRVSRPAKRRGRLVVIRQSPRPGRSLAKGTTVAVGLGPRRRTTRRHARAKR